MSQSQLTNVPQSLNNGMLDEIKDDLVGNSDKAINWVIDNLSLVHAVFLFMLLLPRSLVLSSQNYVDTIGQD